MRTRSNSKGARARRTVKSLARAALFVALVMSTSAHALADQLKLADGTTMQVDEAWEDAQGVWYRRAGVTYWVERSRVKQVVKAGHEEELLKADASKSKSQSSTSSSKSKTKNRRGRHKPVESEPEEIQYKYDATRGAETEAPADPTDKTVETQAAETQPVWI